MAKRLGRAVFLFAYRHENMKRNLSIQTPHGTLHGHLELPEDARRLILLVRAHHAPVDAVVSASYSTHRSATLTMELLSSQEAQFADATQNVSRLTQRLLDLMDMIRHDGDIHDLPLSIFASGDSCPAAIRAAARRDMQVKMLACHGGLIDRAGRQALNLLAAPLLMIFDSDDQIGKTAFERAAHHLGCQAETHTLATGEDPAIAAAAWFSADEAG